MSVITIDQARLYLRIDDSLDVPQTAELQSFIDASESFISRKTGHILNPVTKTYIPAPDGFIRVYDYPIDAPPANSTEKDNYLLIESDDTIDLLVGYANPADVPPALINAALQMLKVYYYESETQNNTTLIPESVNQVIWNWKRFIL